MDKKEDKNVNALSPLYPKWKSKEYFENRNKELLEDFRTDAKEAFAANGDKEQLTLHETEIGRLKEHLDSGNAYEAVLSASWMILVFAKTMGFDDTKKAISNIGKKAAEARWGRIYQEVESKVRFYLENNSYPKWKSADYINHILNQPSYSNLNPDRLRKIIKTEFKALGLDLADKMSKSGAEYVIRKKQP